MSEIYSIIFYPFAWVLRSLYFLLGSYGVAIIFFCLITKIILFPLSLKGKKSMMRMNALSSKQQKLQKQYGKDKERLNAEIQKLYQQEKVNPMGGCLWSLLPLPILIGLYGVIRQPLHYLMGLNSDEISELSNFLGVVSTSRTGEINIAEELFHRFQEVVVGLPDLANKLFSLDFTFLGINLSSTPQWNPTNFDTLSWNNIGLFLIPIVSALTAYLSMRVSTKTNNMNKDKDQPDNPMINNKSMMLTMPLVSLWIGFTLPASLGIYWIANNVFTMFQEKITGKMVAKDIEAAAIEREEREKREKEEEKERRRMLAEARAKNPAKGKKVQAERKATREVLENSRIGIRAYARGRAYDPNRYGGVTPYRDSNVSAEKEETDESLPLLEDQETEDREMNENPVASETLKINGDTPEEQNQEIPAEFPKAEETSSAGGEYENEEGADYEASEADEEK